MATQQIPRLEAELRERHGTRYSRRLRKTGQLPAVVYGHKQDPAHVAVNGEAVTDLLHRHAHLVEVAVNGQAEPCLIKDVQWDHLGSTIVHVDFARVDLTEKVEVEVEVVLFGDAKGLKEAHTFLDQQLKALEVRCLATDIPEVIRVDVSDLAAGESLTVSDLQLPQGVEAVSPPEAVVASIHLAAAAEPEVETLPAEGAAAEPEVLKKGKAEEESED